VIVLEQASFSHRHTRTRFPFRYGIASMTELPHVFLRVRLRVEGQVGEGLAAEGLAPKWFTKNPATAFEEDLPDMARVLRAAVAHGLALPPKRNLFTWWRELYEAQSGWARAEGLPFLLAHLGTSLVERAVLDAFCRIRGIRFAEGMMRDAFGFRLGEIHPALPDQLTRQFLERGVAGHLVVRHTVGLGDPLTQADLAGEIPLLDGLPLALEEVIPHYGLTRFKIKLSGKLDQDKDRLGVLAKILPALSPDYRVTLDGNEQFVDVDSFREAWEALRAEPILQDLLGPARLALVEQPLHRDRAMGAQVGDALRRWPGRPPMIIDESDSELGTVAEALELGYAGSSHKNCKGVFKGIANGLLLDHRRADGAVQTGEDLANIGPVALLQDCSVMALLRVPDVERNGHHYFRGLTPFPPELGGAMVGACPDLYERRPDGTVSLRIRQGRLDLGAVLQGPFGQPLAPATVLELAGVTGGLPCDLADFSG
jgi:hypothetical protein